MRKVICIGDHIFSPLADGSEENFKAVLEGKSALKLQDGTFGVPEPFVASLFERPDCPSPLFNAIIADSARKAARAAGINPSDRRCGIILSSIKGDVEALGQRDVSLAASARALADELGNPNPPLVVSNACISGLAALVQGRRMILSGAYDNVIVTGAELQSRFIVCGFQSLKALSASLCRPFDAERDGLNLGEAVSSMVLSAGEGGWEIVDGTIRNDANHISGPSRTGEGSYQALRYVLDGVDPDTLAFVNVHGTSTLYNDEMEAIALDRAGLLDVPVNALKGCYGHTMGAAGILESILSMRAVDAGVVLPTKGFCELGVSRPVKVSSEIRHTDKKSFVKLLSGFGGVNGALLFRKGGELC